MQMNPTLKWISSCGGPYILATKRTSLTWLGSQGVSVSSGGSCANDYERACGIKDYAGTIVGNPHEILVLGDLPNEMTWISRSSNDGLLVKWVGADSDQQVLDALQSLDFETFKVLPFYFEIAESELCLFDSVWRFGDIAENHLEVFLEPGRYAVSVLNYEPNEQVWLHLIWLKRTETATGHD